MAKDVSFTERGPLGFGWQQQKSIFTNQTTFRYTRIVLIVSVTFQSYDLKWRNKQIPEKKGGTLFHIASQLVLCLISRSYFWQICVGEAEAFVALSPMCETSLFPDKVFADRQDK